MYICLEIHKCAYLKKTNMCKYVWHNRQAQRGFRFLILHLKTLKQEHFFYLSWDYSPHYGCICIKDSVLW